MASLVTYEFGNEVEAKEEYNSREEVKKSVSNEKGLGLLTYLALKAPFPKSITYSRIS